MRDRLIYGRNGFTYGANITILTLALFLFSFTDSSTFQFRVLTIAALGLGLVATLFYICNVNEKRLAKEAIECQDAFSVSIGLKPRDRSIRGKTAGQWLCQQQFYIFGFVYMFCRIALNVTATIIPLYLVTVTQFTAPPGKDTPYQVALVLLVQYLASLLFTFYAMDKIV